ncbi:sugar transferase [Rhodobacter ferrooxidans]|uniref:Sugar transferase n=1 Tax=Rhodobacter ferrooxidans TaxID=371731 RepID=C8S566_9RHOB|nr:sugar transferase [Rhodobacter sp. SW2]EEW23862.1 sugar transferase [Rhodobacter sp. SW2]
MLKRLFDIGFSLVILALCLPLFAAVAAAIKLASPGPVFYRARRIGKDGVAFDMLKFRTMHVANAGAVITAKGDVRIFRVGAWLRKLKIDELPQFLNVLAGQMSVVGPRPEDPRMVQDHYTPWMLETLRLRPGITSPGAVFYYAQGEGLVDAADPEGSYVARLLPPKLAVERAYMERAGFLSDLHCIGLTAAAILGEATGHPVNPPRQDMELALRWVPASAFPRQS